MVHDLIYKSVYVRVEGDRFYNVALAQNKLQLYIVAKIGEARKDLSGLFCKNNDLFCFSKEAYVYRAYTHSASCIFPHVFFC